MIERREGTEEVISVPQSCPVCETSLVREEGEVARCCPSETCPAKIKEQLKHYVSKHCLDIDGLGSSIIEQLVESGLVTNIVDLYTLLTPENLMRARALP